MAAVALAHLSPAARPQALLADQDRITAMQRDRWVDYPRAVEVRQYLERLLATPQRERMPCLIVHGQSNIGKTLILRKFQRDHPTTFDTVRGVEVRKVMALQMPATPDQHRFYSALAVRARRATQHGVDLFSLQKVPVWIQALAWWAVGRLLISLDFQLAVES